MTQRRKIHRFHLDDPGTGHPVRIKEDVLAAEEPLEIRINGTSFAVTMRTPGDDFDLVAGFLVSEGVVHCASELTSLRFCAGTREGGQTFNVVDAQLRPDVALPDTKRNVYTSSSCGICGTESIDASGRRGTSTHPGIWSRYPRKCLRRSRNGSGRPRRYSTGPEACTRRACSG